MSKYLFEASYTAEGIRGLQKAGAASRVTAISDMCQQLGGVSTRSTSLFGDVDAFVICELPDDTAAAAAAFTVGASSAATVVTTKLLTVEEADAAIGRSVAYRPPGS